MNALHQKLINFLFVSISGLFIKIFFSCRQKSAEQPATEIPRSIGSEKGEIQW